MIVFNNVNF